MLQATLELAKRVDRGEIDFCAAAASVGQPGGAATLEIAGGRAVCGPPGSPLNKVLGLGLGQQVTDADLDAIEDFYQARHVPAQIEVCPLASSRLGPRLSDRGYTLQAFENQLARRLERDRFPEPASLKIAQTRADTEDVWLRVVSEGFAASDGLPADSPPAEELTEAIAIVMRQFAHRDITRFIAWIGDRPAGGGASYIRESVAGVFGTATVPEFRRRGVQSALVAHILNLALGRADLAIATTEPGSASQRTFERFGFQVLYTRAIFVKP